MQMFYSKTKAKMIAKTIINSSIVLHNAFVLGFAPRDYKMKNHENFVKLENGKIVDVQLKGVA